MKNYRTIGILAIIAYVIATIAGGALIPGYSHLYNTISEITAADAPTLPVVWLLFALYNLGLMVFAWGLYGAWRGNRWLRASARMLMIVGLLGFVTGFFPQDPRDIPITFNGKMHIFLAGMMSPLTMLTMICAWLGLKAEPATQMLSRYSLASFAATLITGALTAWGISSGFPYGGAFQRLTIGTFLQWLFVVAVNKSHPGAYPSSTGSCGSSVPG